MVDRRCYQILYQALVARMHLYHRRDQYRGLQPVAVAVVAVVAVAVAAVAVEVVGVEVEVVQRHQMQRFVAVEAGRTQNLRQRGSCQHWCPWQAVVAQRLQMRL